jgi:hypothetical protein
MLEILAALAQWTGHIYPSAMPASAPSPTLPPDSSFQLLMPAPHEPLVTPFLLPCMVDNASQNKIDTPLVAFQQDPNQLTSNINMLPS